MNMRALALVGLGALVSGCGSDVPEPPAYPAVEAQLKAFAGNCRPVPGNETGYIKETFMCDGDGTSAGIRLTKGRKLWSMTLGVSSYAKAPKDARPLLRAALKGIVSAKGLDVVDKTLEHDLMAAESKRQRVDGAEIHGGKRSYGEVTQYEIDISWAFRDIE